jgi:peptidyl-dipeptidase Dcp
VNPLLGPSPLPFGFPDFAAIREEHFTEAFTVAMAEQRAEAAAITAQPGPPTFDDTVVALERSGGTLRRVSAVFSVLAGSLATPAVREIEVRLAPALAAHADAITLDAALFARLEALAAAPPDLDPESLRLLERRHRDAVRAGARLGAAEQDRLRALNAELSALSAEFGTRLLAGTNAAAVVVDDPGQLDGLSPDAVAAAARAAEARGHPGRWLLPLVLPTGQPALASLTDRALRERLFRASTGRGAGGDEYDTRDLVRRITALRAQRAGLLGHPHHASWVIEVCTAGTVEAVEALLAALVPAAVRNAEAEAAALDAVAGHPIEPWDRAFHAERLRRERAVDATALRPYLELERVLHDGVFAAAGELYGLRFTERHDLPVYHPDVRVFHVERSQGSDASEPVGLFVADHYARETKRGGAWMNSFVVQSRLLGTRPVVLNTLNLAKPPDGEPTLLGVAEVVTLFHEFGHALHGLLSDVAYPTFAGTGVPRDFVEFPSQVNEVWLRDPAVVARYARHHATGAPLPPELAARLTDPAPAFGEGWATTEYLAAAVLDLAWHRLAPGEEVEDVAAFEAAALAAAGVAVPSAPPRYRSTYFNHVFAGAYSAAYYSYIWSEVLDADTVEWFDEHGGLCRRNGEVFRDALLARGGSVDPMAAYRAFRGRDPQIGPLLARRGLTA